MHFQKQIQKIYQTESIDISSFIIVVWLGRSHYYYKENKLMVYREVILANIKDNTYNIHNWIKLDSTSNINYRVFKIEILEDQLISVKLGDIYNFKGIIINTP